MSEIPVVTAPNLIVGMSHASTILRGYRAAGSPDDFQVILLNGKHEALSPNVVDGHIEGTTASQVRSLFLSLYGNAHNSFAMTERDPRMWTETASGERVPADRTGRRRMKRATVLKHMKRGLGPALEEYAAYRAAYPDAAIYAIATPPPVFDADHIRKYPGAFANQMDKGISPPSLRLAVYEVQQEIMREMAGEAGIPMISPPAETITASGGMAPEYWNRDPSHGNRAYGKLVFDQIRAIVAGLPA